MHDPTLITIAEESGFRRTGRTDEVTRLCAAFAKTWPRAVRSFEFGRSAQGRPIAFIGALGNVKATNRRSMLS